MENNKHLENIWELQQYLKRVTYGKNVAFSSVRLVFLKYIIDNNIAATTKEDFMDNSKVYKMFAARDVEGGPNTILPILHRLDRYYNLNGILKDSIDDYAKDLFGLDDRWNRKNLADNQLIGLMDKVASLDLLGADDETISCETGKQLVEVLLSIIEDYSRNYVRQVADFSTQTQLSKLVAKILDIQDGDKFVDFASGVGKSTIQIVGDKNADILNVEINRETATIASMLYIMMGYQFDIKIDNGLECIQPDYANFADKLFCDYPLGIKNLIEDRRVDSYILAIERALEYLNEKGLAIIPVPGSFLSKSSKTEVELRKRLVENGFVKSIVSIPPCWAPTGVGTNLLILTKKPNKEIIFIEANSNKTLQYCSRKGVYSSLTDEGIEHIINQINKKQDVIGAVKVISVREIAGDFNLIPARYIDKEEDLCEDITIEEIDKELKELYTIFGNKN